MTTNAASGERKTDANTSGRNGSADAEACDQPSGGKKLDDDGKNTDGEINGGENAFVPSMSDAAA